MESPKLKCAKMTSEWKISPTGDEVKTKTFKCPFHECTFQVEYEVAYKDPDLHATKDETIKKTKELVAMHYRQAHNVKKFSF